MIDAIKLRDREDAGVRAVENLEESSKWAALEILARDLKLTITQVDIAQEKIKAFKREEENEKRISKPIYNFGAP